MDGLALYLFAYLAAAVLAVIVTRKLSLGSVVGYILAGVIVGPVLHVADAGGGYLEHFSEFGIVMMLFLIGLEVDPPMVWRLRNHLLGLGGLQVVVTIAAATVLALPMGFSWQQGVMFGCVAALSSTAIVLQTLEEKRLIESDGGRASFAVLLFQDLAVIPMLACIPLLAVGSAAGAEQATGPLNALPGWAAAIATLAAVAFVLGAGHYLSRPLFRMIAAMGLREVFTATALLVVVGISLLMSSVGLSPALGAFLAGVVLANSEFKHELRNDVEPFKGLLLGLFFMTIGAKVSPALLVENWLPVVSATIILMALKVAILVPLALLFRLRASAVWLLALSLAQAGEFGFVLLSIARDRMIFSDRIVSLTILVITLGMILTPCLFLIYDRIVMILEKRGQRREAVVLPQKGRVIVAGVGRFGQVVNRMLLANGYKPVVLDYRADVVDNMRKFGVVSFFGDAGRPDLLESAGLSKADLLIVAIDDADRAVEIVAFARRSNPGLRIIARAYDRLHHYKLDKAGADHTIRELFNGSVDAGGLALQELGMHPYEVEKRKHVFVEQDVAGLRRMAPLIDGKTPVSQNADFIAGFNDIGKVLQSAMLGDARDYEVMVRRGWNPPVLGDSHVSEPRDLPPSKPASRGKP